MYEFGESLCDYKGEAICTALYDYVDFKVGQHYTSEVHMPFGNRHAEERAKFIKALEEPILPRGAMTVGYPNELGGARGLYIR